MYLLVRYGEHKIKIMLVTKFLHQLIGPLEWIQLNHLRLLIGKFLMQKYPIPENWMYKEARELFKNPEVTDPKDIEVFT